MASYQVRWELQVADIDGDVSAVTGTGQAGDADLISDVVTQVGDFATAVQAASNGKITRQGFSILILEAQLIPGTPPPTDATYPSVTSGARMNFSNSLGSRTHVTVPAPKEAVFLGAPQRDIVDPAGSASGLIAFMKANAEDAGGNLLNLYQGGIKVGRGARRRRPVKAGLS